MILFDQIDEPDLQGDSEQDTVTPSAKSATELREIELRTENAGQHSHRSKSRFTQWLRSKWKRRRARTASWSEEGQSSSIACCMVFAVADHRRDRVQMVIDTNPPPITNLHPGFNYCLAAFSSSIFPLPPLPFYLSVVKSMHRAISPLFMLSSSCYQSTAVFFT